MIVLALDTTTELASVALRRDGVTLAETSIASTDGHGHLIYEMIRSVLDQSAIALHQVDCFATAIGPGSFTGVRICVAAAKGLAEATSKPVAGISNLRALATFGSAPFRCPIIDARRGQIYSAVYDASLAIVSPEVLTTQAELVTSPEVELMTAAPPLAAAIALCAELDGPAQWLDPAALDANYVRRADAELYWTDTGSVKTSS